MRNLGHDATSRDVVDKGPCCRLIRVIFGMAFKTSRAICSWFKFAAVIGEIAADLATGSQSPFDLEAFSPRRLTPVP